MGCATGLQINHRTAQRDPGATSVTSWDAARSGSDAALQRHRRPACVEAAAQPRDGCAAGMRNGRGAVRIPTRACTVLDTGVSRLPNRHRRSSARPLDRLTQREGAYPSWNAVGRAGLDPSGRSGSGMDPPGFSAGNAGKSQKLRQLSPDRTGEWKAPDDEIGPPCPDRLLRCDHDATGLGRRLVPPYAAGEDAAHPQPQQRPVPVHLGASQRPLAPPDLITPVFPAPGE